MARLSARGLDSSFGIQFRNSQLFHPADGNSTRVENCLCRGLVLVSSSALTLLISSSLNARAQQPAPSSTASPGTSNAAPKSKPSPSTNQQSAKASQKPKASPAPVQPRQVPQTNLPDMSITATRISQPLSQLGMTVTVVDKQQIQDQKIQQTSDALREVPGVQVTQSGGPGTETDVTIRGSSTAQVLTLLDGVEVNTGGLGAFDFANLTTANASRIEVIRGAGGSLYGSSAIGGVINQISEEGTGAPKFSLLSDGGNWDTERQIATASGAIDRLGYSGSVSYYSTSGFQPVNSDNDNLSLTSRLDYHLTDDTVLRAFARYTFADVGLPESQNFLPGNPLDPTTHQRTEFMLYKGEIDSHITDKLLVRMFGSYVRDEVRINMVPSPGLDSGESIDVPDEIWGYNAEAVYTWCRGFDTLAGFDFKYRWGRDGETSASGGFPPFTEVFSYNRKEYAGYVQQQGRFFDGHLLVTGGFRVDGNSQFGKEVSPAWSVALPFDEYGVTLRGSYAEGFQAPTFDDLYFPDFGNPNLQAMTSSEYDGGIEKRFGEFASITTTYFSRRIHNLITDEACKVLPRLPFGAPGKHRSCGHAGSRGGARHVSDKGTVTQWQLHGARFDSCRRWLRACNRYACRNIRPPPSLNTKWGTCSIAVTYSSRLCPINSSAIARTSKRRRRKAMRITVAISCST